MKQEPQFGGYELYLHIRAVFFFGGPTGMGFSNFLLFMLVFCALSFSFFYMLAPPGLSPCPTIRTTISYCPHFLFIVMEQLVHFLSGFRGHPPNKEVMNIGNFGAVRQTMNADECD